jgi:chlorobactene glucosyltransferase
VRTLSAIIFIVWVLSFVRTLLNLVFVPRLRRGAVPASEPLVSVVVPARNEARVIERAVRALLASAYRNLEVIVVDDCSTDGTGRILGGVADPRLIVVDGEEPPPGWLGKPWALRQGSARARGELLLFVDADVTYEPEAVGAAVAALEQTGRDMLTFVGDLRMEGFWENAVMPNLAMFGFTVVPAWFSNRSKLPILGIGGGMGNLVRREAYDAAGGHDALKDAVVDDVALARLVRHAGRSTAAIRADGLVSVRMYHGLREIVDGFTKNSFSVFGRNYFLGAATLVFTVLTNFLPFVLAFTGDRFAIASVALIVVIRIILFAALRYSILAAIFLHPLMIAVWGWIMLRSMWITGVRRQLPWRGRVYDARSTRFGAERK